MAARKRSAQPAAARPAAPTHGAATPLPAAAARRGRTAALLFLALFAVYVLNFRLRGAGDSIPTRLLPFSILREGDLDLNEYPWQRNAQGRLPYYVHEIGPHIYSVSTIATALVVTPLYVVPAWYLSSAGIAEDDVRARVVVVAMERISAAVLTALSASLLYLALARLTSARWALGLALVYGLGTTTWVISSQALWAHGLSELTLTVLCLVLLAPAPSTAALVLAGLAAGVAVANRPQMAIFAALALAYVAVHHRRRLLAFALLPAAIGAAVLAYNRAVFQALAGGYGGFDHFRGAALEGLAGLFASPNRGLFVFTPIMIFALWGAIQVWRVPAPAWLRYLTVGVALHVLVHAKFNEWWAGYTYGPRYLTDVLPALTLFLVYGLVPLCRRRAMRVVAAVLALYGGLVQAIGVYAADDDWNRTPVPLEQAPRRVWDWSDLQIARSLANGVRAHELAGMMFDAFRDPVPAHVRELDEADLRGAVLLRRYPRSVAPGSTHVARVKITNRGARAWPAFTGEGVISARYQVFLLVRWFAGGQPLAGVGDVIPLPQNVAPDETIKMRVPLTAPAAPGALTLELRVTQAIDGRRGIVGPNALRVPVRVE
jgi:hypothetical protein